MNTKLYSFRVSKPEQGKWHIMSIMTLNIGDNVMANQTFGLLGTVDPSMLDPRTRNCLSTIFIVA